MVQDLDEQVDRLEGGELAVAGVDADGEEEARVAAVDDLVGLELFCEVWVVVTVVVVVFSWVREGWGMRVCVGVRGLAAAGAAREERRAR